MTATVLRVLVLGLATTLVEAVAFTVETITFPVTLTVETVAAFAVL